MDAAGVGTMTAEGRDAAAAGDSGESWRAVDPITCCATCFAMFWSADSRIWSGVRIVDGAEAGALGT